MYMKPINDNWNIVLLGAWNTRIFNPKWLGEHVFGNGDINAALSLIPGFPSKFSSEDLEIAPTDERLIIRAINTDDLTVQKLENVTRKILGLLRHTPVRAVGINMAYRIDNPIESFIGLFALPDDSMLISGGYFQDSCSITRAFPIETGTLNLILSKSKENIDIQFNFHLDVEDANGAFDYLENKLIRYKQKSIEIAQMIYELELGED